MHPMLNTAISAARRAGSVINRASLDLAGLQCRDAGHHLTKDDMELLVYLGFQHTVLDHEIDLLLDIGSDPIRGIGRQGAVVDRVQVRGHGSVNRGHAGDHVLIALPFGAIVQRDLDSPRAMAVMIMGLRGDNAS